MSRPRKHRGVDRGSNTLMVVLVIGGGALLLLLGALAILGDGTGRRVKVEVTGQPRLRVDQDRIDLGDVRLGQTVKASFVLANVGDQPLSLTQAPYIEVLEGC